MELALGALLHILNVFFVLMLQNLVVSHDHPSFVQVFASFLHVEKRLILNLLVNDIFVLFLLELPLFLLQNIILVSLFLHRSFLFGNPSVVMGVFELGTDGVNREVATAGVGLFDDSVLLCHFLVKLSVVASFIDHKSIIEGIRFSIQILLLLLHFFLNLSLLILDQVYILFSCNSLFFNVIEVFFSLQLFAMLDHFLLILFLFKILKLLKVHFLKHLCLIG